MAMDSLDSERPLLIVEDDEAVREAMREALEEEGYSIISAADGEQALDLLASGPRPRLILLDLMMPVMNGWELLKVLRDSATLARIPVVILSAAGNTAAPAGVPAVKSRSACNRWCASSKTTPIEREQPHYSATR